jgi:hypothetical protein
LSIVKTFSLQDDDEAAVIARANAISSTMIDPYQLSLEAIGNCTEAVVLNIQTLQSLSVCTSSSFAALTSSISAVLQRGQGLPSYIMDKVDTATLLLSKICQNVKATGETPESSATNTIRLLSAVVDGKTLQQASGISIPTTSSLNSIVRLPSLSTAVIHACS